jgi:hypothetical protein
MSLSCCVCVCVCVCVCIRVGVEGLVNLEGESRLPTFVGDGVGVICRFAVDVGEAGDSGLRKGELRGEP